MALITRVSRLFQADFHAVLDRIEEPEVLLRQAVREMEEELAGDEQRSRVLKHEQGQLTARDNDLEQSLHEIEEQLDVCFDSGNDDLVRATLKRKLEMQQYCKGLARKRQVLQETLDDLDTRLGENRARLESMRQKAELLAEETARVRPPDNWAIPDITIRDEDVEVALLREKQKRRRT
jgi:phage shock protein A